MESQRQNEAINQLATEVKKAEHDKMAKQYTQEIKNAITLKIDNIELNRKMKELKDILEEKEERNKQLKAELSPQKESERLLKLDHQRNQEAHHGERMIELIKSVADKVAKSNQEDLEVETKHKS